MNSKISTCTKLQTLSSKSKGLSDKLVSLQELSSRMKERIGRRIGAFGLLFALGAVLPGRAWAYDGITIGQVAFIEQNNVGSRFGFQLVGYPSLCTEGPSSTWGIFAVGVGGATPEGVKAMLATVMAAKLSGLNLRVYAYNNGADGCIVASIDIL